MIFVIALTTWREPNEFELYINHTFHLSTQKEKYLREKRKMTLYDKEWVFVTWARDVTDLHGIKHIVFRGSRLRKAIWLVFVCACVGTCLLMTGGIIWQYFQFNHTTNVDVITTDILNFPSVTLCNLNKYRSSAITARDVKNVGYFLGEFLYLNFLGRLSNHSDRLNRDFGSLTHNVN